MKLNDKWKLVLLLLTFICLMLAYFFNFPWPILLVYVSGLFFHTERKYVYYGAGWRYKEIYTLLALEYTVWFVVLLLIFFKVFKLKLVLR